MPHCSPGRLDNQRIKNLDVDGRTLECWEAFIHIGVLYTAKGRIEDVNSVLMHHYNVDGSDAKSSVTKMSNRLRKAGDKNAYWLFTRYEEHKQFWMDKGQDIILEYDPEAHGTRPGIHIRNLEVPIDLRTLLDLKHSHITLNPANSGPLLEEFKQIQNPGRVQSSSQGQRTDSRIQHDYLQ